MATGTIKCQDAIVDYNGANGLLIKRTGRVATLASLPTASTDSSGNVGTITDSKFMPVTDIDFFTQVYNGSSYIDCWFRMTATGQLKILTASGGTTAGLQAQYLKIKGLTYVCNG